MRLAADFFSSWTASSAASVWVRAPAMSGLPASARFAPVKSGVAVPIASNSAISNNTVTLLLPQDGLRYTLTVAAQPLLTTCPPGSFDDGHLRFDGSTAGVQLSPMNGNVWPLAMRDITVSVWVRLDRLNVLTDVRVWSIGGSDGQFALHVPAATANSFMSAMAPDGTIAAVTTAASLDVGQWVLYTAQLQSAIRGSAKLYISRNAQTVRIATVHACIC
jgi:hypothetical protein